MCAFVPERSAHHFRAVAVLVAGSLLISGCAASRPPRALGPGATTTTTTPSTTTATVPATTTEPATTTLTQATTTVAPATTTTPSTAAEPTTTAPRPLPPAPDPAPAAPFTLPGIDPASTGLPTLAAAYNRLLNHNRAASVSVIRDHVTVFAAANGLTATWQQVTPDSPMVIASVSKLVTALSIARLAQGGLVDLNAPVPWDNIGVAHHPAWNDVTPRELLAHTSGMPVARKSWLDDPGLCSAPLAHAMVDPPRGTRGTWTYSNGNYCALGLLVELATGLTLDQAAQQLVFDPAGIYGPHLTTHPEPDIDVPYMLNLARLDRLGGAGTWMASTDDVAAMLDHVAPADMDTLVPPGIIVDQYGWGHTGTVDGAKSCAWVLEGGRTVITATVSGNSPTSGGGICDIVLPALATDLGLWADRPIRVP